MSGEWRRFEASDLTWSSFALSLIESKKFTMHRVFSGAMLARGDNEKKVKKPKNINLDRRDCGIAQVLRAGPASEPTATNVKPCF